MSSGGQDVPDTDPETVARIRRELAHLGSDTASAPEVPPEVTARIGAALRDASHAVDRPALSTSQRAGLAVGLVAVAAAVVLTVLSVDGEPTPKFPAGPTASKITVDAADPPPVPLSDRELRDVVAAAPDLGPLSDPARLASCLTGLRYPASVEVAGARPLQISGRPAILLTLAGDDPDQMRAVAVGTGCGAKDAAVLAETTFTR